MAITRANHKIDMTTGPILPKMLRFAIPLILSSILQLAFNAADVIVVGQFCGDASLAAVSSNGAMVNLLVGLFTGMSVGTNVLCARYFGVKNDRELSETVHTSVVLGVICGIFATVIGLVLAPRLLILMQVPDNVLPLATLYLRVYFAGITSTLLYNFGAAILRAVGDTRRPLYYLIAAGVVNVVLNLIFVTLLHMDVAGVALATAISQTLSAFLVLRSLLHENSGIRLIPAKLRLDRAKVVQIVKIGLPAGLQGMMYSISNVIMQSSINLFGDVVMSGNGAAANIEGFGYMSMNAFYQATVSFTSQNYGVRRYKRITRSLLAAHACVITIALVFALLLSFCGSMLLGFYTDSEEVIKAGLTRFNYIGIPYVFCGVMDLYCGALRGIGSSIIPMVVAMLGACGVRVAWIYTVFQIPQYHVIDTVYTIYPISWIITALAQLICFVIIFRRVRKRFPSEEE